MPRAHTANDDMSAIRADIAELSKSLARIQSEMDDTRAAAKRPRNGEAVHANGNGHDGLHEVADELMAGALKLGTNAAGTAGGAAHAGAAWIDDMLRKNPTPAVLTALGVGFILGVMGRR